MATLLAMRSLLAARDPFADAKDTLSSWDKCMAKTYCKWPVIVAIIVGGIIVFSVVLCIARCVCCGAELACCCFKCCSCCCPSGGRTHKRVQTPPPRPYDASAYSAAPPAPPIDTRPLNQQYRSHAAPTVAPAPVPVFNSAPKSEQPQFATFDARSKPANEDALPAMPSWSDARNVHVEEEVIPEKRDDVEMDRLDHNGSVAGTSTTTTSMAAVAGAGAARRSPGPGRSPVQRTQNQDGYGFPQGSQNGSFADNSPQRSQRSLHYSPGPYGGAYDQQHNGYRGLSPVQQSLAPVYGAGAGYAHTQQYDRRSPGPGYDHQQPYGQNNLTRTPSPLSTNTYGYGNSNPYQGPVDVSPVSSPANTMYQNPYAPAPNPMRDPSPVYASPGAARYDAPAPSTSPAPVYPGQQTYTSSEASYPGQQGYQAYAPSQNQAQQYSGVPRKAVEGSWRDV